MSASSSEIAAVSGRPGALPGSLIWRTVSRGEGLVGTLMILAVLLLVLVGPAVAPHASSDFVGKPYNSPSATAWLGTDYQGHDVLSGVLHGGMLILGVAGGGLAISIGMATLFGLFAGTFPGWRSTAALRLLDVALIFPPIVLGLLVLTRAGTSPWLLLLLTVATQFPSSARIFWAAARAVGQEDYIESARSLGLSKWELVTREVAPNIVAPILAEIPIRFAYCIAIVATLAFLGFGAEPPAVDWGTMINQNKGGLTLQPWPVVAPVFCIAVITVGANLLADALRTRLTSKSGSGTI
jgi:peptide/nickel transport system permease protein